MRAVYGEGAVTNQMCQKGFAKFCAGDFCPDTAQWFGRAVGVDRKQIKTLVENNQHSTMKDVVDILKISKSIKLLVKMKNVSFLLQTKPHELFGQSNILIFSFLTVQLGSFYWPLCKVREPSSGPIMSTEEPVKGNSFLLLSVFFFLLLRYPFDFFLEFPSLCLDYASVLTCSFSFHLNSLAFYPWLF